MKEILGKFLDILFPRNCLVCDKLNPKGKFKYLCKDCASNIYESRARCTNCSEFLDLEEDVKTCVNCVDTKFYFSESFCSVAYREPNNVLLKNLKYKNALFCTDDIAQIFEDSDNFLDYIKDSVIIPIPLHKKRLRQRKFNQSLEIAKAIRRKHRDILIIDNALIRVKNTPSQTSLSKKMRRENMKNAFAFNEKVLEKLPINSNIILLDDVMTTGATLNECAKVLSKHSYKNIKALCFAKRLLG